MPAETLKSYLMMNQFVVFMPLSDRQGKGLWFFMKSVDTKIFDSFDYIGSRAKLERLSAK